MNTASLSCTPRTGLWKRARSMLLVGVSAATLALAACGGSDKVDRGPTTIPVSARLNGLYWDAQESRLASERELISGLNKPVGLAVVGDQLFVTDQGAAQVLAYSLAALRRAPATAADGRVVATFTPADGLDLMTAGSDGTLYVGSNKGTLYQIGANGTVKALAEGWPGIRGLALDAENRRLFAAVVAADDKSASTIRIVPLD